MVDWMEPRMAEKMERKKVLMKVDSKALKMEIELVEIVEIVKAEKMDMMKASK